LSLATNGSFFSSSAGRSRRAKGADRASTAAPGEAAAHHKVAMRFTAALPKLAHSYRGSGLLSFLMGPRLTVVRWLLSFL